MKNYVNEIIKSYGSKEYKKIMLEKTGIIELEETCEGTEKEPHIKVHKQHNTRTGETYCPSCLLSEREKEQLKKDIKNIDSVILGNKKSYLKRFSLVNNVKIFELGFKSYKVSNQEQKEIVADLRLLTNKINTNNENFNIFIGGATGRGKTHLAMGVVNNVNEIANSYTVDGKGKRCVCINLNLLASKLKESYNDPQKPQETYYKNIMKKADVLLLDDLGAEIGGVNTKKEAQDYITNVLYEVMDAREDKTTIVTSNLTWEQITKKYDSRFISRLSVRLSIKEFKKTEDYRLKMMI